MNSKKVDIEKYEDEILKDLENDEFVSVANLEDEMKIAKQAASNFTKRDNRINIRISGSDLNMIRKIAVEEGLPYQTLLASIIHKFASGRLIDKLVFAGSRDQNS